MDGYRNYKDYCDLRKNGGGKVIPMGYQRIDSQLIGGGVPADSLIYLLGKSGVGKTWLLLNVFKNLLDQGKKVLFFSFEMNNDKIFDRLLQLVFKKNIREARKYFWDNEIKVEETLKEKKYFENMFIVTNPTSIQGMESVIKSRDWDFVLLDHFQLVRTVSSSVYERSEEVATGLMYLKKEYSLRLLVLLQMRKGRERAGDGSHPPMIEEARGGSQIEDSADVLLGIWRPDISLICNEKDKGIIKMRYIKNRIPSPEGNIRTIRLPYDRYTGLVDPAPKFNL